MRAFAHINQSVCIFVHINKYLSPLTLDLVGGAALSCLGLFP